YPKQVCGLFLGSGLHAAPLHFLFLWTHSLHYNLTVRSQGGSVQSRFFADCYWDHQLFLHYDSHDKESAKPQELWAEKPLGTESWDTEIWELIEHGKNLKATLAEINALQEQKGGSHSLQETWGCKTEEDNHTRGFWDFHYDGEPFLSYHPETHSWKVEPSSAQILAMEVKNSWDADDIQSKDYKAHVGATLVTCLTNFALSSLVSPAVNVTCAEALEDTINMTCWAFGFYPQNISVTWLQDGEPRSQGTQQSWGVFPYVNGTYQTWVSIRIPQGQEQRFCCYVGYRRNNSTGRVSCGTALLLESQWPPLWWYKRRTSAEEGSGEKIIQWLKMAGPVWDVGPLMPPAAQRAVELSSLWKRGWRSVYL
uniref:Ig-like domain-containing protein n=1 Tax=Spermophilus dauricus TaxID=99837 RepID=A0A8C9UUN6_SPEDA